MRKSSEENKAEMRRSQSVFPRTRKIHFQTKLKQPWIRSGAGKSRHCYTVRGRFLNYLGMKVHNWARNYIPRYATS
jgi:hypothetical protein